MPRLSRMAALAGVALALAGPGRAQEAESVRAAAMCRGNAVTHWNTVAIDAFKPTQGTNPMGQSRTSPSCTPQFTTHSTRSTAASRRTRPDLQTHMARRWTRPSPPRHTTSSWHKCLTRRRCWKMHTRAHSPAFRTARPRPVESPSARRPLRRTCCGAVATAAEQAAEPDLRSSIRARGLSVHAAFQLRRAARLGSRGAIRHRAPRAPGTRARPPVRPAVRARPRVREGHRQDRQPDPHRGAIGDRAVLVRGLSAGVEPDRKYDNPPATIGQLVGGARVRAGQASRSRDGYIAGFEAKYHFRFGGRRRPSTQRRPTAID